VRILGLDVSTSKTGWCLLDVDGKLSSMGCILLQDQEDLFAKTEHLVSSLKAHVGETSDLTVVIEEPLLSFARGASSASVLLTLNRFNGMVTHACWKELGVKPVHLNVIFARRSLGIKRDKTRHVKEVVLEWATGDIGEYQWPTRVATRGKNKGQVLLEEACYDMADAYVMARARKLALL
jgi:Holliday junction resolvasome RuvABC endonuclease subunit